MRTFLLFLFFLSVFIHFFCWFRFYARYRKIRLYLSLFFCLCCLNWAYCATRVARSNYAQMYACDFFVFRPSLLRSPKFFVYIVCFFFSVVHFGKLSFSLNCQNFHFFGSLPFAKEIESVRFFVCFSVLSIVFFFIYFRVFFFRLAFECGVFFCALFVNVYLALRIFHFDSN